MLVSIPGQLGTFGRAAALSFVAELGDKTFFLTVILAAWCPVSGIRNKPGASLQQAFVAAGAVCAMALHVSLLVVIPGFPGSHHSFFDWSLGSAAVVFQGALGMQAMLELRRAERTRKDSSTTAKLISNRPLHASKGDIGQEFNPSSFLGTFKAYNPDDYESESGEGGAPAAAQEAGKADPDRKDGCGHNPFEDEVAATYGAVNINASAAPSQKKEVPSTLSSASAALLIPFVAIFLDEVGDKSLEALRAEVSPTIVIATGATIGYMISSMFAACVGFLLERQLTERRLLFAMVTGLWALVLVTCSQAILHVYGSYLLRMPASTPAVNAKGDGLLSGVF